jgi:hypothetical protein
LPIDPALLADGTVPVEIRPTQVATVTGRVFINADFADNSLEGNIFDRRLVVDLPLADQISLGLISADPTQPDQDGLASVVLTATAIEANGTFNGDVEIDARVDPDGNRTPVGTFGGVFGGQNADAVAGVVDLTQLSGDAIDVLELQGDLLETGIFVLDQCGQAVDAALCDAVNPTVASP